MSNSSPYDDDEEERRGLIILGRDVSKIPCFRNTFLYGVSSALAVGITGVILTSRPQYSYNLGMGAFFAVSMSYWMICRYNHSKQMHEYRRLQALMKQQNLYEGTDSFEAKLEAKSESV